MMFFPSKEEHHRSQPEAAAEVPGMPGAKQLPPGTAAGVKNPKSSALWGIDHAEI